jgi:hypothetical protein
MFLDVTLSRRLVKSYLHIEGWYCPHHQVKWSRRVDWLPLLVRLLFVDEGIVILSFPFLSFPILPFPFLSLSQDEGHYISCGGTEEGRGKTPQILNLCARWGGWSTQRPFALTPGKCLDALCTGGWMAGSAPGPVWEIKKENISCLRKFLSLELNVISVA